MPQIRDPRTGSPCHIFGGNLWIAGGGHVSGNQRWRLPLGTDGQFLAAASAAPGQNGASVLGLHAGQKPVGLGAVAIVRLKSTFRHVSSIIQYRSRAGGAANRVCDNRVWHKGVRRGSVANSPIRAATVREWLCPSGRQKAGRRAAWRTYYNQRLAVRLLRSVRSAQASASHGRGSDWGTPAANSRRDHDVIYHRDRLGNPLAPESHTFNVELDGFRNQPSRIFQGGAGGDTSRKIRDIGAPVIGGFFKHHGVFHHFLNPACFRIEFSVPGARSSPSCQPPALVLKKACRPPLRIR
jgi:hypothetical protein